MQYHQPSITEFREVVWDFYHANARQLPWREPEPDGSYSPYKILVSEIMLQQTQVARVIPKYERFLQVFPDIKSLAGANLGAVLREWSGLGYNRRAKYLHEAAKALSDESEGVFPQTLNMLTKLPGVGQNTAAAILVYAYNQAVPFVETNIRTVYIHHFYNTETHVNISPTKAISDKQIIELVAKTMDTEHPREFFWALMDYGSYLKKNVGNSARASKHYSKQSTFQGSKRQIRGLVLRMLAESSLFEEELQRVVADDRLNAVIAELVSERMIVRNGELLSLP